MKGLQALFGIFLLLVVVVVLWKVVPPYFANQELQDAVTEEARINTYTPKTEEDMRSTIFRKAQDLDIPITRDQIQVQRATNGVSISVAYTVHVDLPAYPLDLNFQAASRNRGY